MANPEFDADLCKTVIVSPAELPALADQKSIERTIMDFSKLSQNNMIAGGGGIVALIATLFPWYSFDFGFGASASANAWDAGIDAWGGSLLVAAGGILVALKAMDIFEAKVGGLETEQFAMILAAVGLLLQLINWLGDNDFTSWGLYLSLVAAIATGAGAFLSGKDKGIGIPSADDFTGGGGSDGDAGAGGGSSTF